MKMRQMGGVRRKRKKRKIVVMIAKSALRVLYIYLSDSLSPGNYNVPYPEPHFPATHPSPHRRLLLKTLLRLRLIALTEASTP